MPKFKVGDKVRIRKDLRRGERYYMEDGVDHNCVTPDMLELCDKIVTVVRIAYDNQYIIEFDGVKNEYHWTDEMFEGLATETITKKQKKEIKLEGNMKFEIKSYKVIKDKVVIVEFADGDIQKSVCDPKDNFDEERGLEVCIMKHICGKAEYHKAIKEANKQIKALADKAEKEKAEAERLEKKEAKRLAYVKRCRAKRAEAERKARVDEMKEAYLAALKEYNGDVDKATESVAKSVAKAK